MKTFRSLATIGLAITFACLASSAVLAHPMTHQGTVLTVEAARIEVKTVDEKTKKEDKVWFVVDKTTKVKRGDKLVSYANAKITAGERIVIIVDMDAKTKMLAEEIPDLAAK